MNDVTPQRKPRPSDERGRRALTAIAAIIVVAVLTIGGAAWAVFLRIENPVPAGKAVQFEVARGADTREIAARLAKAGVIDNANMFRLDARLTGAGGRIKVGVYDLTTGMSDRVVIAILEKGPAGQYDTVAIPEGFTIDQIAERVRARTGISAEEFKTLAKNGAKRFPRDFLRDVPTDSLEGYLFPKTYRVAKGATASEVIGMMLDQFGKETSGLDLGYARTQGLDLHGVVTIASMIERETRRDGERPIVSSVVYNRLRRDMFLEIDATVQYVLGNKARLLYRDLQVESPYNTYLHKGLPPGPIAVPGIASLRAAAAPARTGYLWYVLTGKDGSHTFATNKSDFLKAKQLAKEGLR